MIYTVENTILVGKAATVYVNGNKIDDVVMVDTEKNLVEYMPRPIRPNAAGDDIYTETITGDITIEWSRAK